MVLSCTGILGPEPLERLTDGGSGRWALWTGRDWLVSGRAQVNNV